MNNYESIHSNVNLLGDILGNIIKDELGEHHFNLIEQIRRLAKDVYIGNKNNDKLLNVLHNLKDDEILPVVKAFNQFLNLVNTAEQYQETKFKANQEVLKQTIKKLKDHSKANEITNIINNLSLELVLTAHPTEITRRSIIGKMVEINACLSEIEDHHHNQFQIKEKLKSLVAGFWYTDEIRKQKPTPIDEAKWGISVVENSLWNAVSDYMRVLHYEVKNELNITLPVDYMPVCFTSWMGGDRDGNANVTAKVTKQVLMLGRWKACELFIVDINKLITELSIAKCNKELQDLTDNHHEPYRFLLKKLKNDLLSTKKYLEEKIAGQKTNKPDNVIDSTDKLWNPLFACYKSLTESKMEVVANGNLRDTLWRIKCFGVYLLPIDIRQESTMHTKTISEITEFLELGKYEDFTESEKIEFLLQELNSKRPLIPSKFPCSSETQEVLDTFRSISTTNKEAIKTYVISMAKSPSDVLAVCLLLKELGTNHALPVVPLFETLEDLNNAKSVMQALFNIEWYRKLINGHQMVMIGYSDSAKDAGMMAASWAQYKTQEELIEIAETSGIKLTLFHGRGGTIGRGGAPAYAALLSQPPGSLQGGLRVTEQGEMIRFKYGLTDVALNSLCFYTSAILEANVIPPPVPQESWRNIMEELSHSSCAVYRSYVQDNKDFVTYFRQATPELEIAKLPLGSRPAKRKVGDGIKSLRAIPWIFAWMQNRLMLPSWLGSGVALREIIDKYGEEPLEQMCENWPFFSTRIAMLEMVFAKSDTNISKYYDEKLVDKNLHYLGNELRDNLQSNIETVLSIANDTNLMEDLPWIAKSVAIRNMYTDPLNFLQAELLLRIRANDKNIQTLEQALMVTIAGIAAGMRNTG